MKRAIIYFLIGAVLSGGYAMKKHANPGKPVFVSWANSAPSPTPTQAPVGAPIPDANIGTPAPVIREDTVAIEPTPTWEALSKVATPIYERCITRALRLKTKCGVDRCADAYTAFVWPEHQRWGRTNVQICESEDRERKAKVRCVRKALKIADPAESYVAVKECG
jgi:hypothetical protein